MSRKFKVPVGLVPLVSNPGSGSAGDTYFNTTDNLIYVCDGVVWSSVSNFGNLDGGQPDTVYGGLNAIDAGGI